MNSTAFIDKLIDLTERFSIALLDKLKKAEVKYGRKDDWLSPAWETDCQRKLLEHVAKGDPLDVAAYAAFCWHHRWRTSAAVDADEAQLSGADTSTEAPTTVRKPHQLEPLLPGETRSEYLDRLERAEAPQQMVARIKRSSKYAHQAPKGGWFDVRKINRGYPQVVGNNNAYDRSDLTFGVRLADGSVVELK